MTVKVNINIIIKICLCQLTENIKGKAEFCPSSLCPCAKWSKSTIKKRLNNLLPMTDKSFMISKNSKALH